MSNLPRPRLITTLSIIQMALAAIYLGGVVYLCYLASTHEIQSDQDPANAIKGLLIGAAFSGAFAFASVIAALGLWWNEQWGRWLAVVLVGVPIVGMGYAWFDGRDVELLGPLSAFALLLVLYLLPAVGRALKAEQSISTVKENA